MSAPYSDIRAAFVTRLLTFPSLPPVAWENFPFTPTAGTTYLRPALLPGEPAQAEIGENGMNRHNGIYQISIFSPSGGGIAALNTLRDGLIDFFKRGTVLTYGVVTVTIIKAYANPMIQETDWVHTPITIKYELLATN